MSTSAVTSQAPAAPLLKPGLISRLIVAFSGTTGLAVKIAFLAVLNAVAIWAVGVLVGQDKWLAAGLLVASTLAIDAVYLVPKRTLPAKFLLPGTVFLVAFSLIPILYTLNVGFTNWSTGHLLTKSEAIDGIKRNSLAAPADGRSYVMAPARNADGTLVLLLVDEVSGKPFVGTREGIEPLPPADVKIDEIGLISSAQGYEVVKGPELLALDAQLRSFTVPTQDGAAVRPEGLEVAVELQPTLRYDAKKDAFVRIEDGAVFRDNDRGSFVAANREELEPGWRTNVGLLNFKRVVQDPLIRAPFLRVFVWTFVFATLSVLTTFALGLFLAIVLDKAGMRFQRTYRSILVIPYAIPGFLSILIWSGLLNDDFGIVNRLLHTDIPWLFDGSWAKVSLLLVNLWLGFPYFFLVSMGTLQSIPAELHEAARVDGGGRWQLFRLVTLPLLLVAVAPLMIASFAFNFNNFGVIYLLTGGGPPANDGNLAGSTDILISYTFKIAFANGKGQDFGLGGAISILIFFIVASISAVSFWRSRALENMR